MWFLCFWITLKIKTSSVAQWLCVGKVGMYCAVKGVSIPDHNLVCGEKASHCGC